MKNKNIADMSEKEYEEWFLNRLRSQRKNRIGSGAIFEAFLGTGTKEFISFAEQLLLRSAVASREIATEIVKASETEEGRQGFEAKVSDLRKKANEKVFVQKPSSSKPKRGPATEENKDDIDDITSSAKQEQES